MKRVEQPPRKVSKPGTRDRAALRRIMADQNMNVVDLARAADLAGPNLLYNYFNGHTQELSTQTIKALSKALQVPVHVLLGIPADKEPRAGTISVRSATGAGQWRSRSDLPLDQQFEAPVVVQPQIRGADAFGVVVRGPGAEKLYPDGTILIVVPLDRWEGTLVTGRRVILQHIKPESGEVEVTVRELEVRDGYGWLVPKTDEPAFAAPTRIPWPFNGKAWRDNNEKYMVAGVVVQALIFEG